MGADSPPGPTAWRRAALAAALFAVDPAGTGFVLRARAGPVRARFLALLQGLFPDPTPWRTVPAGIDDGRLLGGLDVPATLALGRPVAAPGLLASADRGVVVIGGAERLPDGLAGRIACVLDSGEVLTERDGLTLRQAARFGLLALDEGAEPEEAAAPALAERLAFMADLDPVSVRDAQAGFGSPSAVAEARLRFPGVSVAPEALEALCAASAALGVGSARAWIAALRAARAHAALAGRDVAVAEDVAAAAALVFAHRATRLPAASEEERAGQDPPPPPDEGRKEQDDLQEQGSRIPEEIVLAAVRAAIPAHLLASLEAGRAIAGAAAAGKSGALARSRLRGRPAGVRPGDPRQGRIALVDTLRAAAPWQSLRRDSAGPSEPRIMVKPGDVRIRRHEQRRESTTIFAVDASGSSALQRLAEAKGAVELLLADCYVRRDRVALVAFRGAAADLVLPPTRSLARARRCLAGLPGGGGTPLAAGLETAGLLAESLQRRGHSAVLVVLTDGKANIARDGTPGRSRAMADATAAANRCALSGVRALLVDTSPRPQPAAEQLAVAMRARYLPLPHADAARVSRAAAVLAAGP